MIGSYLTANEHILLYESILHDLIKFQQLMRPFSLSLLNRRLHEIDISIWPSIFHAMSEMFHKNNQSLEYLVDSMPMEVCMNVRSYRCK